MKHAGGEDRRRRGTVPKTREEKAGGATRLRKGSDPRRGRRGAKCKHRLELRRSP